MSNQKKKTIKPPSLFDALIPIIVLILLLALAIVLYGDAGIGGPIQIALMLTMLVAAAVGFKNGHSLEDMGKAAVDGISSAMGAIFILLAVGSLIGTWNMAGTIPSIVYYGIQILNPNWYYLASAIISAILALSIGSAWTVAGTLGIGLIGIAGALGVSPEITAGAVISGAYFGDKMSPLSETTNLAPAVAGTDLYTHIKGMLWTTLPSILIALIIFGIIGYRGEVKESLDLTKALDAIQSVFHVGLLPLIPLLVVLILSFRRVPAFITIFLGALTGGIVAVFLQPDVVLTFGGGDTLSAPLAMLKGVWSAMSTGFVIESDYPALNDLFSQGGMSSMMETVWLILSAMAFGGVMDNSGLLARLIRSVLKAAQSDRALLIATGLTSIGVNVIAGDQYMSIVLPGRMYREAYEKNGIAPQTLSRQIEDTGTITSPLIPWNSCGAYMSATLGIVTMAYLPFCFFNWINVIISFLYALAGFQIKHLAPEQVPGEQPAKAAFYGIAGQQIGPKEHESS